MISLRNIPSIDEMMQLPEIQAQLKEYRREFIVDVLRQTVDETRQELRVEGGEDSKEALTSRILQSFNKSINRVGRGDRKSVV